MIILEMFIFIWMFNICATERKFNSIEAMEYVNLGLKHVIMSRGGSNPELKIITEIRKIINNNTFLE